MSFQELLFNVDTGYLEALVRGFRSGILTQSDYLNLSQCETLEGNDRIILVALCSSVSYQKRIFPFFYHTLGILSTITAILLDRNEVKIEVAS